MTVTSMQPIRLRIPGTEITEPTPRAPGETSGQITIHEVRTFRISSARAGGAEAPVIESRPDDIVEVELEDGTRFWTSQERLRTEVLDVADTRAADGVVELPATLGRRSATRGLIGKIVIKTLKFFRIDVAEKAALFLADKLEKHVLGDAAENRGPGLYRLLPGDELTLAPVAEAVVSLPADRPSLLFLHGTASSTTGSFHKLWTENRRPQRQQLLTPYEGRVFGLEHETLTKSPIDNAIAAAERLPPEARLHLVSHSRGGMIGELLCRAGMEGGATPLTPPTSPSLPNVTRTRCGETWNASTRSSRRNGSASSGSCGWPAPPGGRLSPRSGSTFTSRSSSTSWRPTASSPSPRGDLHQPLQRADHGGGQGAIRPHRAAGARGGGPLLPAGGIAEPG